MTHALLTIALLAARDARATTDWQDVTSAFVIVGDTQEHLVGGQPIGVISGWVDAANAVTIRRPQQPFFGDKVFEYVAQQTKHLPLIHLGDLLDLSCVEEFERIATILSSLEQPWVIAPGNHDGAMNGVRNSNDEQFQGSGMGGYQWRWECTRPRLQKPEHPIWSADPEASLSKDEWIERYLNLQAGRARATGSRDVVPEPTSEVHPVEFGDQRLPTSALVKIVRDDDANGANPSGSFIVQKVGLPAAATSPYKVSLVLIDTSNVEYEYAVRHLLRRMSVGDVGHLSPSQLGAIERVLTQREANEIIVLGGHHDWSSLDAESRRALERLLVEKLGGQPFVYLSAHTHEGWWKIHRIGTRELLELNVSSLADWPLAYRLTSLAYSPSLNRLRLDARLEPSLASAAPSSPADADLRLRQAWHYEQCGAPQTPTAGKIDPPQWWSSQGQIVLRHRANERSFLQGIPLWFQMVPHALRDPYTYVDSLNDLNEGLASVRDLVVHDASLEQTLAASPTVARLRGGASLPQWLDEVRATTGPATHRYEVESTAAIALTKAIDDIHDRSLVSLLACRAATAAMVETPHELRPPSAGRGALVLPLGVEHVEIGLSDHSVTAARAESPPP